MNDVRIYGYIVPGLFYATLSDAKFSIGKFMRVISPTSWEIMRLRMHHSRDSRPWTRLYKLCSSQLTIVRYSLEQRLIIYNTYIRKKSLKTCRKFRRHFPGISVQSTNAIQQLVEKVCETGSVVNKKIKSLGYCERKSVR